MPRTCPPPNRGGPTCRACARSRRPRAAGLIEAGLGDLGPRSKLLDAVEDVPAEQPLRLPMTIVCPHSETNRVDHTKANTQLDWAYQIARANVRKQQNSLIAIYASGIDCKKIACSFPGVAMLADDSKDNKHSDVDRQVTVIETGRTATGAWAIKTIQRAVSNMDGVVDMLKANGSRSGHGDVQPLRRGLRDVQRSADACASPPPTWE